MNIDSIMPRKQQLKHLKWVEVIQIESQATKLDSMYILEKNKEQCEVIFIDSLGSKRKVSGVSIDSINKGFASIDASNLTEINIEQWRNVLKVLDLPLNVARVDDGLSNAVYNKDQIDDFNQLTKDLVVVVNTHTEQITEIISVNTEDDRRINLLEGLNYTWSPTDRTLTLYNSEGYEMSQVSLRSLDNEGTDLRYNSATKSLELYNSDNEILDTIPVYEFVGNVATQISLNTNVLQLKDSQGNILSSVTFAVSNIGGLQTALDGKLNKPTIDGSQFVVKTGDTFSYKKIIPSLNHLLFWDGFEFVESAVYHSPLNSKLGIGTQNPTEQLHLTDRIRTKAVVLEDIAETLPQQITYNNRKFWGTDSTGTKKQLMYNDFADYRDLWTKLTDTEKDQIRLLQRKTGETYSLGQPVVEGFGNPIILHDVPYTQYQTLIGINLFLNNSNPSTAKIELRNTTTNEVITITNFEAYQTNPSVLSFSIPQGFFAKGEWVVRAMNNNVWSIENPAVVMRVVDALIDLPIPSLTWTTRGKNELEPQLYTGSNLFGIRSTPTSMQHYLKDVLDHVSDIYVSKSNEPIVTVADMQKGVMLEFDIDWDIGNASSWQILLGLTNDNSFNNNNVINAGLMASSYTTLIHSPINKTFVITDALDVNAGYVRKISDKLVMIISKGLITIYLRNRGKSCIQSIDMNNDLYIKMVCTNSMNYPSYYWTNAISTLTRKVSLEIQ